jgi:hypothetical protein
MALRAGSLLLLLLVLTLLSLPTQARAEDPEPPTSPPAIAPPPTTTAQPPAGPADPEGAEGLRLDLERIIVSEESGGWFLDATHYDAMHPAVLQSACRATPEARQQALERLRRESAQLGDPRARFDAAGRKMTSDVEKSLHVMRMKAALARAMAADCPFWVTPIYGYSGRQTDARRFTLNGEIGTLLQLRYSSEKVTIGASPSIRILAGYTFGHVGVMAGGEFSAGPMIREDDSSKVVLNYFPAAPVVVRIRDNNWIYSIETGLVTVMQGDDTRVSFGVRGGAGIGLMALRTRYFIPWAGIALYYEHFFEGVRPSAEFLRGGLRIGIIFDP